MIIIGEKINSSIPASKDAIEKLDREVILSLAEAQAKAGADYIDINAGMFLEREGELLSAMAGMVGGELNLPVSIDTPSWQAAEHAAKALKSGKHLINSVTIQPERLENMTALARDRGFAVVALCMSDSGMPENIASCLKTAGRLVTHLTAQGIKPDDIFIDPMLKPLGADENSGTDALETIRKLRALYPECHISCGLSNLSYGLPKRKLINRAFAVAAVTAGLDAAILDPLDRDLMGLISAAEAVSGHDEYCLDYIGKCREGLI